MRTNLFQEEQPTEVLELRGKGSYDDYTYWGGMLPGVEIVADRDTGQTSTGTFPDWDQDQWDYFNDMFGGQGGSYDGGSGSGGYGGNGGTGSNPGSLSEADCLNITINTFERALSEGRVVTVGEDEKGVFGKVTTVLSTGAGSAELPFDVLSMWKGLPDVVRSIGTKFGIAGLTLGAANAIVAFADGDYTTGDIVGAVGVGIGAIGMIVAAFPAAVVIGGALTTISVVVGIVGTAINEGSTPGAGGTADSRY